MFSIIILMLLRLLITFTIFSFIGTTVLEAHEIDISNSQTELSKVNKDHRHIESVSEKEHCDDCKDDGCSDSTSCCQSFCSCSTSYYISSIGKINCTHLISSLKIQWYLYSNYRSPFLDRALRPPLFS